jgi:uncharacterized protein (DUF1800 family)
MNPVRLSELAFSRSFVAVAKNCGRAVVTATLCVLLVEQPLLAEAAVSKVPSTAPAQLAGQEKILHALNRLTFGPRPGDVAAVQAMGLRKWFEQQLNPSAIDDSRLDAMLAEFPAMQMSQADLQRKYPSPQILRGMSEGRIPLPGDAAQRAMVQDQIAFYKIARARQEQATAPAKPADGNSMNEPSMADGQPAMAGTDGGRKKRKAAMAADSDTAMMADAQNKQIPASELAADPMMAPGAGAAFPREESERIMNLPVEDRIKAILALQPADLIRFRQSLRPHQLAQLTNGMTPSQKEMLVALPGSLRMVALETMESRVMRDIYSDRQLEAVMTDFWLNHFNVYVRKNQNEPYLIPGYERETIRPHALGNFEDLLVATAKSPAMLVYLDNFRSVGPNSLVASRIKRAQEMNPNGKGLQQASAGLNENYGRELMELHTLGVGGGYTQADVTNVAKVFTGWGLDRPYQGGGGGYAFEERRHEPGPKVVLGKTISEAGETEGREVLHMLATSPATAHFISQKLAVRFVSDTPPATLVDKMADSFLKSHGDIKTVLRTMFEAPEFWTPAVYRAKVKTPIEFVISAARASNLQVANPAGLVQALDKLGMPLYGMQTPNGYSWKQDEWVSTGALVSRMNFSLVLSANKLPGTRTSWATLLGEAQPGVVPAGYSTGAAADTSNPAIAKETRLEQILLGQPVSERTRNTVLGQSTDSSVAEQAEMQFDLRGAGGKGNYTPRGAAAGRGQSGPAPDDPQAAIMAGLLLGSPEFQRR